MECFVIIFGEEETKPLAVDDGLITAGKATAGASRHECEHERYY